MFDNDYLIDIDGVDVVGGGMCQRWFSMVVVIAIVEDGGDECHRSLIGNW